ncbi:hypothetical protein GCM10009841_31530 [Microlunatus panaciterrae]
MAAHQQDRGRARSEVSLVEKWFLDQGVPFVVRYAAGRRTIARMTPGLVLIFLTSIAVLVARLTIIPADPDTLVWTLIIKGDLKDRDFLVAGMIMLAGLGVGITGAVWTSRRRGSTRRLLGASPGLLLLGGMLLVCLVHSLRYLSPGVFFADLIGFAALVISLYLLVRGGVSALFVWALRRALPRHQDLVRLLTRALPLQLVLVSFLFISTEAWQVADSLSAGRLAIVALFFGVAALLFLITQIPRELEAIHTDLSEDSVQSSCRDTPLQRLAAMIDISELRHHRLERRERVNLVLTLMFAQGLQVFGLGLFMFVILIVFGTITIDSPVIAAWVLHPPTPVIWFGLRLPYFSTQLVHVATMIASFAALQFAVLAVTDSVYRVEFFDSMVGRLSDTLVAREVYLAGLEQHQLGPSHELLPWQQPSSS